MMFSSSHPRQARLSVLILRAAMISLSLVLSTNGSVWSQEPAVSSEGNPSADEKEVPLATRQESVSLRYRRFENTLLQLTDYLRKSDPERAELLVRVLGKSKESRIPDQFSELISLLEKGQLGDAIETQETLEQQMQLILTLLQSEDRQSELEAEEQRLQALVRDVDRLISKQTDARAVAERNGAGERASEQQKKVAQQTQELLDKIRQQEAARRADDENAGTAPASGDPQETGKSDQNGKSESESASPTDAPGDSSQPPRERLGKSDDPSKEEGQPQEKDGTPSPDKPDDKKESGKPQESSEGNSSDSGKPQSGKPQSGKPQAGKTPAGKSPSEKSSSPSDENSPSENSPSEQGPMPGGEQQSQPSSSPKSESKSEQQTPGRNELEQARRQMERAIEELKQQKKENATDRQDQAIAELMKAKEKLEEILRQLREEEQELLLAALESRFRDMLARQINVYNGTLGLAAVKEDQRSDRHRTRAIELARNQDEVALLAAKALTLLKEEGSSIAFPEAITQIREDMLTSGRRLERVEVGELTQGIQKDVIESLEEILDSLQKEMEKKKDKDQQQQQQQQGQPQDPALVDALAEMKMLRSLQYRINRRTKQLGRAVDGEQARDPDAIQQLRQLSARQAKIQQTAYDLATEKNK